MARTELRPLHGVVTAVSCIGANGAMARYRLTIEPWLRFLGVGRDSAVFQDMSVLDIVQSIFTDYQSSYQGAGCRRRLNIEPPCRSNIDPGRVAGF